MVVHWSSSVVQILQSKTGNLKELAEIAGVDWRTVYIGQSLANCDLRGQDLSGINLTGCEIERAQIDASTTIDPEFAPKSADSSRYVLFRYPSEIDWIVKQFASENSYTYLAWAYRNLISRFLEMHIGGILEKSLNQLSTNQSFHDLIEKNYSGKMSRQPILLENWKEADLTFIAEKYPDYNVYAASLFVPALWTKTARYKNSDLSSLKLSSVWPRS